MRIGVVFTGGTIGSRIDQSGYISAVREAPFLLLEMYREQYGDDVDFFVEEPYCILSENLQADHLLRLAACVESMLEQEDLEGIVITHGTDTLQYSAAFLGYIFGGAKIPVILVSSNYVLEDSRANGFTNFGYAVDFIKGGFGKGVFVSYCNQGGFPTLHKAVRLQLPVPYSDAVYSVADSWYGRFEDGFYVQNPHYGEQEGVSSVLEFMEEDGQFALNNVSSAILRISPYVGMSYPVLTPETKVVLHETFHSGTIGITEDLKDFAARAAFWGTPIYLIGLSKQETYYETVREYEMLGIRVLPESAVIAQYCKLWMALSNRWDMEKVMQTPVAGDFIAKR